MLKCQVIGLILAYLVSAPRALAESTGGGMQRRPAILLELFTSEGCSSCPPADALLPVYESLGNDSREVIVLSEHVDYWNYLGWKDPFSKALFSARQNDYCRKMRLSSCYTPQMVVNGASECNGASTNAVRQLVSAEANEESAGLDLRMQTQSHPGAEGTNNRAVVVTVAAKPGQKSDHASLFLTIVAERMSSRVSRGENSGRDLVHHAVVLDLKEIARVSLSHGYSHKFDLSLTAGHYLVCFLQDPESGRILAAASCH